MGPADIAAMIHLIRCTTPDKEASSGLKKGIKALVSTVNASTAGSAVDQHKSQAVFERVYFSNRHVSDACVVLVSTRALYIYICVYIYIHIYIYIYMHD